ncbi:MAG TPA: hypothetical protein VFV63_18355 [Ilumatobacteraceae bacterium]|nr:hypothetical protein [Ilumatobacteraceae bacterium]
MDIERQISEHLAEAAGRASATPDLAEVELGSRRVRGRRRVATGVAAAMLVAGAGGAGFGLGRGAGGSDDQIVAPAQSADSDAAGEGGQTPDDIVGPDDAGQAEPANDEAQATPAPVPIDPPLGAPGTMSGAGKGAAGAMPAYELVLERVTDSGITIRALRGESWYSDGAFMADPNGWIPARWCHGDADLRIGLSGPGLIDVTSAMWYSELHTDVAVSATNAGWADGQSMGVIAVQVGDGVTEVAATSGDVSDRAAPTGGAVVLLLPGIDPFADGYTVEVTDASGTRALTEAELNPMNTPEWREACEPPPPPLPDAGEQPADAAAAEAAVRDVFSALFGSSVPYEEKPDGLLDDETGVLEALEVARNGDFADAVATAVYSIEDFVFTSPTEAWFRYGIDTDVSYFGQRYGTAHLIDGSWRIARAVVCQDVALAGAPCEPDPGPIYPPSWYEMYGDPNTGGPCMELEGGGAQCVPPTVTTILLDPAGEG